VTPDWVTMSYEGRSRLDELRYHPRLIIAHEPGGTTPPRTPEATSRVTSPIVSKSTTKAARDAAARTVNSRQTAAQRIKESFISSYEDPELDVVV